MADLEKLVEELSSLTVLEAADLSKMLEEKWGVSAAAPVAVAAAAGGADAGRAEEETRGSWCDRRVEVTPWRYSGIRVGCGRVVRRARCPALFLFLPVLPRHQR